MDGVDDALSQANFAGTAAPPDTYFDSSYSYGASDAGGFVDTAPAFTSEAALSGTDPYGTDSYYAPADPGLLTNDPLADYTTGGTPNYTMPSQAWAGGSEAATRSATAVSRTPSTGFSSIFDSSTSGLSDFLRGTSQAVATVARAGQNASRTLGVNPQNYNYGRSGLARPASATGGFFGNLFGGKGSTSTGSNNMLLLGGLALLAFAAFAHR